MQAKVLVNHCSEGVIDKEWATLKGKGLSDEEAWPLFIKHHVPESADPTMKTCMMMGCHPVIIMITIEPSKSVLLQNIEYVAMQKL